MAEEGFTRPASDPAANPGKVASGDSTVSRADPIGVGGEANATLAGTDGGDVQPNPGIEPVSKADAPLLQFPSLAGQTGVEVSERSADVTAKASKKHRKVFVVFTGRDGTVDDTFDHAPNITATRQYMIDHGLRPVGDVVFAGKEDVDDRNVALTYEVEALPAAVAVDPDTAHVVVSQD